MFRKKTEPSGETGTKNDLGNDFLEKRGARILEITGEHITSQEQKIAGMREALKRMENDGTSGTTHQKQINNLRQLVDEYEALEKDFKAKNTALSEKFNNVIEEKEKKEHAKSHPKDTHKPTLSEVRRHTAERQSRQQSATNMRTRDGVQAQQKDKEARLTQPERTNNTGEFPIR